MVSELQELGMRAEELTRVVHSRPEAERARRLSARLASEKFLVSVVGEFKRGKSTLVNALLGEEVLPTGVLPLTAVSTEAAYGDPEAFVDHDDGTRRAIGREEIVDYVTEERNPNNERRVLRVEVRGHWPLLAQGMVLVDTPGIGSVHRHNTEAARAALLDADGAILVLSASAPMSEQERDMLEVLANRRSPTFFVLTRADDLSTAELARVRRFVKDVVRDVMGQEVAVFAINARASLAKRAGYPHSPATSALEFDGFRAELEHFVAEDLVAARLASARAELARIANSLTASLAVETAAQDLEAAELSQLIAEFEGEAARQRSAFEDNRTLLSRDVALIVDETGKRLAGFAKNATSECATLLEEAARTASKAHLDNELQQAIETSVRNSFEAFRQSEEFRVEQAWQALASGFRTRVQSRVDAIRDEASRLFAVVLPDAEIPAVAEQTERFFYLFLRIGGSGDWIERLLRMLIPAKLARRRALARALAEVTREFEKHAGRARWDLAQRLETVRRHFDEAMRAELDETIDGIAEAAARGREWMRASNTERCKKAAENEQVRTIATALASLDAQPSRANLREAPR